MTNSLLLIGRLLALCAWLIAAGQAAAAGMSFTPASLRVPIEEIGLFDPAEGTLATLWQCSAWRRDHTGCYVDLMNGKAVAGLFNRALATIPPGRYSQLYRTLCPNVYTPFLQVKGTVVLNGVTLYTTGDPANPLTEDPKLYGYAELPLQSCVEWSNLPRPVTVTADERSRIDIVYFVRDIAYALEGGRIPGSDGIDGLGRMSCVQGKRHSLCVNALDLLPYDGRLQETVETYYVATPSKKPEREAFAQIHLAFDEYERFVGGVTQVYFEAGSQIPWPAPWGIPPTGLGKNPFFMPVQVFQPAEAGPGSFLCTAWGANPPDGQKSYFVKFPNFERKKHTGTFTSPFIENGASAYRVYPRE